MTTNSSCPGAELRTARPPLRPRRFVRWVWRFVKDVAEEWSNDGVGDLAAAVTFWTVLSIPAGALALVSALSSLESIVGTSLAKDFEASVQSFITDTFRDSETLADTVGSLFDSSSRGVVTVAVLVALFTLSRAFAGLIRALDVAYEVESGRSWWYQRLVAIGLGAGTIVIVAAAAVALALLPRLPLGSLVRVVTVPSLLLLLTLWAVVVFHVGPNHRTPVRYELPGAIITALGWALAPQVFALYVRLSEGGNSVQSSVAGILLGLTLLHVLSIVLIIGAEVNDVLARRAGVVEQARSLRDRAAAMRELWGALDRGDDDDSNQTSDTPPPDMRGGG